MNAIRAFRSQFYQSLCTFKYQKNLLNDNHVTLLRRVMGGTTNRMLSSALGHAVEKEEKRFICGYEDIKELHDAPENVKRIFSLKNANQVSIYYHCFCCYSLDETTVATEKLVDIYPSIKQLKQNEHLNLPNFELLNLFDCNINEREKNKVIRREIKDKYDGYSERTIAELTLKINTLQSHCKRMPKDKHNKVFLQWLTDQRNKKLKYLEKTNFEKYLEIIKELDIAPLESSHTKWNKYKFRKFKLGVEVKDKRSFLDHRIIT